MPIAAGPIASAIASSSENVPIVVFIELLLRNYASHERRIQMSNLTAVSPEQRICHPAAATASASRVVSCGSQFGMA
jgi:Na+-transporting methylmalonyl-CoA/oxaloacetate decarboxylase beta subunit